VTIGFFNTPKEVEAAVKKYAGSDYTIEWPGGLVSMGEVSPIPEMNELLRFPDDFTKRPHPMMETAAGALSIGYSGPLFHTQYLYEKGEKFVSIVVGSSGCEVYEEENDESYGYPVYCEFNEIQTIINDYHITK